MSQLIKRDGHQKGFSLVEMLISMVIFTIVMGIIYSYILQTKKNIAEAEVELNTADNAQTGVNSLRKDLYQIGVGRDSEDGQPMLLRASMYDIIFVADLDREIRDPDKRYGSIDPNNPPPFSGSPFSVLYYLYNPAILESWKYTGWDRFAEYGYKNIGAEVVRYSLDSNHDTYVNVMDLEDNMSIEGDRTHTFNENDFWLFKEWWGCVKQGSGYINQHSGLHPVAFNLRGMYNSPEGGMSSSTLNRFVYPNGEYPRPLFTYWGHFYNTITANDDPSDEDWPGEPIELWGDWGGLTPTLNQPSSPDPSTGARDGVLSLTEINFMYNNPLFSQINLNYLRSVSGRAGEGETQDLNGNGILGENRLDQFIRRIGVTIVTESDLPNDKKPNLRRSNLTNPSKPVYYYYQDYEVSIQINPRNLAYAGSPEIQMTQMTPTPAPPTPTPAPPTNTPDPSLPTPTPVNTATPDPMHTPSPTPVGAYDPRDGEVILGTLAGVLAISIDQNTGMASDVCNLADFWELSAGWGHDVIDLEPANFCDTLGFFDAWNDLVIANDANNGDANLIYFKHIPNTSINGFTNPRECFVGGLLLDQITCIEVGNIGSFGFVPTEYDEVVVAYRRPGSPTTASYFLEVFFLNNPCGDLINIGGDLPVYQQLSEHVIKDMVIADFDGDGLGELVTMSNATTSDGIAQIRYYPDLNNTASGWTYFHDWHINWGVDIDCAKILAANTTNEYSAPVEKDLVIVAENGDFRIIQNLRTGIQGSFPFPTSETDFVVPVAPYDQIINVTGAEVYNKNQNDGTSPDLVLAISGNCPDTEFTHIVHYNLGAGVGAPYSLCTGPIFPYNPPTPLPPTPVYPSVQTIGLAYVPVREGVSSTINRTLVIPSIVDLFTDYSIALWNPCYGLGGTNDPYVNCQLELNMISTSINCLTTTRNEYSDSISSMPTPTPIGGTPTP
ncbi:prepilin-type N-terminal cleavage/methylation domain-containing protein [bacterium]|nr:prepilin-type N-terminal cleavage/methylation domain-containing protein [candidate division CSSED10-310 bacterium]